MPSPPRTTSLLLHFVVVWFGTANDPTGLSVEWWTPSDSTETFEQVAKGHIQYLGQNKGIVSETARHNKGRKAHKSTFNGFKCNVKSYSRHVTYAQLRFNLKAGTGNINLSFAMTDLKQQRTGQDFPINNPAIFEDVLKIWEKMTDAQKKSISMGPVPPSKWTDQLDALSQFLVSNPSLVEACNKDSTCPFSKVLTNAMDKARTKASSEASSQPLSEASTEA
jgi:hypothetical protein